MLKPHAERATTAVTLHSRGACTCVSLGACGSCRQRRRHREDSLLYAGHMCISGRLAGMCKMHRRRQPTMGMPLHHARTTAERAALF